MALRANSIINFIGNSFCVFLCFSILQFSTHHIVCHEITDDRISKSQLQLHHCSLLQKDYNEIDLNIYEHDLRNSSHAKSHKILTNISTDQNCIDQHIQFASSSFKTHSDLLFTVELSGYLIRDISHLEKYEQIISPQFFQKHIPVPSYLDSIIRTTVLLI